FQKNVDWANDGGRPCSSAALRLHLRRAEISRASDRPPGIERFGSVAPISLRLPSCVGAGDDADALNYCNWFRGIRQGSFGSGGNAVFMHRSWFSLWAAPFAEALISGTQT